MAVASQKTFSHKPLPCQVWQPSSAARMFHDFMNRQGLRMGFIENWIDDLNAKDRGEGGAFAFGADGALEGIITKQLGADLPIQGQILRAGAVTHLVVILMVGHIEQIMAAVLHAQVPADG